MPKFEDFRGLQTWTPADLTNVLALSKKEDHLVEYKAGAWIVDESKSKPEIIKKRYDDLREYAAGLSNVGGGLMFLGVPEGAGGTPAIPDGMPTAAWGSSGPVQTLGNVLSSGIFPRMYPPPRIFPVPISVGREVIVLEFLQPLHPFYSVTHAGGWTPIRFADSIKPAPPALVAALAGERANRPILELAPITGAEQGDKTPQWHEQRRARPAGIVEAPFRVANHGTMTAHNLRIGLVTDADVIPNSMYFMQGSSKMSERYTRDLPTPLVPLFKVSSAHIRNLTLPFPLGPMDEVIVWLGGEMDERRSRDAKFGVWVTADGARPVYGGYRPSTAMYTEAIRLAGPPFDLTK